MTDQQTTELFETRFADRARAYTDVAIARPFDALAVSRAAMSSRGATGWSAGRLGADGRGGKVFGLPWTAAAVAVVLIGVVTLALLGRPSDHVVGPQSTPSATPSSPAATAGGPIPDALQHAWERPYAVTPGLDRWPTGILRVTSGLLEIGPEPGDLTASAVSGAGPDMISVTTTVEAPGCSIGAVGTYRWVLEGKGTTLALTAIDPDACAARETALVGSWVRSDLPPNIDGEPAMPPGTHETAAFDPFADPSLSGQLSFTVPAGWSYIEDHPGTFVLHRLPDAAEGQSPIDTFVFLYAEPRLAADFEQGATCGPATEAPGVGHRVEDLVEAILARPGVVSTPPEPVTFGGYEGLMLDLRIAPSWTGGCLEAGAPVGGTQILLASGSAIGPVTGIGRDHPTRLILLDLTDGRTMAIAVGCAGPSATASSFDAQVAAVMPVIESFEFHPPKP